MKKVTLIGDTTTADLDTIFFLRTGIKWIFISSFQIKSLTLKSPIAQMLHRL